MYDKRRYSILYIAIKMQWCNDAMEERPTRNVKELSRIMIFQKFFNSIRVQKSTDAHLWLLVRAHRSRSSLFWAEKRSQSVQCSHHLSFIMLMSCVMWSHMHAPRAQAQNASIRSSQEQKTFCLHDSYYIYTQQSIQTPKVRTVFMQQHSINK